MDNLERADKCGPIAPDHRHIVVLEIDGVVVVRFRDIKADLESVGSINELAQELEGLTNRFHAWPLVLDFEGKHFVFSDVFFAKLIRLLKSVKQVQGSLKLCDLPTQVVDVLRITRLVLVFPLFKSLDHALAGSAHDPRSLGDEQETS